MSGTRRDIRALIDSLPERIDTVDLLDRFVPPRRFSSKDFEGYRPGHPTQATALARLEAFAGELHTRARSGLLARAKRLVGRADSGRGVYLDGGFGVGKTHLLAALWNAAPDPKSYVSFDELMWIAPRIRSDAVLREEFRALRLLAVDEWELDDPGNLKMALAVLRVLLPAGVTVAATSNTLPLELGSGRFSQKDFLAEIEELSGWFEVVHVGGADYRHRHFRADPGREYFLSEAELDARVRRGSEVLAVEFGELLEALAAVHPLRYAELVDRVDELAVAGVAPLNGLPDALRWVHLVDRVYNAALPFAASGAIALADLFPAEFLAGPYGKKCSRCLSRMEELLTEARASSE